MKAKVLILRVVLLSVAVAGFLVAVLTCSGAGQDRVTPATTNGTGVRPEGSGWNPGSPLVFSGQTASGDLVEIFQYEAMPDDWVNEDPAKTQFTMPIPWPETETAQTRDAATNADAKDYTDYIEVWTLVTETELVYGVPQTVQRYGFIGYRKPSASDNNTANKKFNFITERPGSGKFNAIVAVAGREHVIAGNPKKPTMRPVLLATGSRENVIVPVLSPGQSFPINVVLNSIEYQLKPPYAGSTVEGQVKIWPEAEAVDTYPIIMGVRLKSKFVKQNFAYPLNKLLPKDNPIRFAPQSISYYEAVDYQEQDLPDTSGSYPGARIYTHRIDLAPPADAPRGENVQSLGEFQNVKWVASIFEPLTQGTSFPGGNVSRLKEDYDGDPIFVNEWSIADYRHPDTTWAHDRFSVPVRFGDFDGPFEDGFLYIAVSWGDD